MKARFVVFCLLFVCIGICSFAFVALSIVVESCFYAMLVSTLGTSHTSRIYKWLNYVIILFTILSFLFLYDVLS
jgi:hypothetical protein